MRTVVENRHGISSAGEEQNTTYVHLNQHPLQSKSCFYDFGERKPVRFVECDDDETSEFIESLIKQFCS